MHYVLPMPRDRALRARRLASVLSAVVLLVGVAPTGAGCRVFDEGLLVQETEGEDDHGEEGEELVLADECFATVPVVESADGHRVVSTVGGEDNMRTYAACGYTKMLPGPEGYFSLQAAAGDRWHIAVTPEDDADVATVILTGCDVATCVEIMDRCGPGLGEEITLVADQARTYLVAVETATDAGTEAEIIALRAQCGDGVTDHGEACDDGNLVGDDGCDPQCRAELRAATSQESEPNNWHTEANVLAAAESIRRVAGTLGGPCDTDHYFLRVPEGTTLSAVMTNGGEQPCTSGDAIEMVLMQGSTSTVRGMGIAGRLGGTCPSLEPGDGFNDALPEGEYHLIMTAPGSPPAFDYVLRVELIPTA